MWFYCAFAAVDADQVRKGENKWAAEGEIATPPGLGDPSEADLASVRGRENDVGACSVDSAFIGDTGDNGFPVSAPLADGWGETAGRRLTSTAREAMSTTAGGERTYLVRRRRRTSSSAGAISRNVVGSGVPVFVTTVPEKLKLTSTPGRAA